MSGKKPIYLTQEGYDELNQELDLKFDEASSEYDTIAGLIV